MPPINQQKMVAPGEMRTWELDLDAMASCAGWASQHPALLQQEMSQLHQAFPTFLAAVGVPLSKDDCWVEAAEPLTCPVCNELVVFNRGTRCATCNQTVPPPADTVVGVVGRIPAMITGRPLLPALEGRLAKLRRSKDSRAELFARSLLEVKGRQYLAPRFGLWFSQSWPHEDPPVMVWPEYFDMLDIQPDHVYVALPYYRLCLYASWVEQPAVNALQHRVAPRLLIDLMMADLNAAGKLELALDRLDASLYEVYNMVGQRGETGEQLRRVYNELVDQP